MRVADERPTTDDETLPLARHTSSVVNSAGNFVVRCAGDFVVVRPSSAVGRAHTGYGLLFLLILAILVGGLFQGVSRSAEESFLLQQLTPRPRPTLAVLAPITPRPEGSSRAIAVLAPTASPTPTPADEVGPSPTPGEAADAPPVPGTTPAATAGLAAPGATPASALPPTATAPPSPIATPRMSPTPPPGSRLHVVEPGDTLFELGLHYGSTVDAIMAANGIVERTEPLRVGARLVIPPR